VKLRLRFIKQGKIRFTGHRDVARLFERAIRIVGIPVAYSEGFSPRQRVSFGLALPTCYESESEFLDIFLTEQSVLGSRSEDSSTADLRIVGIGRGEGREYPIAELVSVLSEALPTGIEVTAADLVERGGPSLQENIISCTWRFEIQDFDPKLGEAAVARVLALDELVVERMKKRKPVTEDVRPAIIELRSDGAGERGARFITELSSSPRVVRPAELVPGLAPDHELAIARRIHQWTEHDGVRSEPLAPPVGAPRAERHVS
jgi:hypothetical protein